MIRVAVTGANGYIGVELISTLKLAGYNIIQFVRKSNNNLTHCLNINDVNSSSDWQNKLEGVDVLIHLAARVHVMQDKSIDPLQEYREINTLGTQRLANAAADAGVKRFIYISTIKVNGEHNLNISRSECEKFKESDTLIPADPYAISKWEAEKLLREIEKRTDLEVVVIRPPLVYGPGVKANFLRLLAFVYKERYLPLGSVQNKRSIISINNLVDFIITCISHPQAKGQTFLVSDDNDISTPDLIAVMGKAMGKRSRVFRFPVPLLKLLGLVTGKLPEVNRLCGSLQVDISKAKYILQWTPPVSLEEGIKRTVAWYLNQH